jgi:outer membrane protein OmpA-like peptidoglycan-associated protein
MKLNCFLLITFLMAAVNLQAQFSESKYPISGGFLVGANYSWLQLKDYPDNFSQTGKFGFTGGFFANLPFGDRLSLQPQLMYSVMGGQIKDDLNDDNLSRQKLYYASLPVLVKYQFGKYIAVFAGPQADYLFSSANKTGNSIQASNLDQLNTFDVAATAGIEFLPRDAVFVNARYIYGFMNIPKNTEGSQGYYNQGVQITIGARLFGNGEKVPPPPPPPPPDTDSDGIIDSLDKCPGMAGVIEYQGCPIPDTDNDGVKDPDDKCPSVAGVERYNGCPIPDTDEDGFNDETDKCPTEKGVAEYNGCPIPDTDGDGLKDPDDHCPTIAGVSENHGCPAVEKFSASNIQFITGSAQLTGKAITALNQVVAYMQKYPDVKLDIRGHTDDTGDDDKNQKLSENRAAAVKAQLVKKGISADRLSSEGFGETQPIADNTTAAGRAENRRVEFDFAQ